LFPDLIPFLPLLPFLPFLPLLPFLPVLPFLPFPFLPLFLLFRASLTSLKRCLFHYYFSKIFICNLSREKCAILVEKAPNPPATKLLTI
jgi:hypothetical protein